MGRHSHTVSYEYLEGIGAIAEGEECTYWCKFWCWLGLHRWCLVCKGCECCGKVDEFL